jgi:hypothetical protein
MGLVQTTEQTQCCAFRLSWLLNASPQHHLPLIQSCDWQRGRFVVVSECESPLLMTRCSNKQNRQSGYSIFTVVHFVNNVLLLSKSKIIACLFFFTPPSKLLHFQQHRTLTRSKNQKQDIRSEINNRDGDSSLGRSGIITMHS